MTPLAPPLTANVTVQYDFPIGDATKQRRVRYSHMDRQYANLPRLDQS